MIHVVQLVAILGLNDLELCSSLYWVIGQTKSNMIDLMGNEWKVIMEKVNGKMKMIDWRGQKTWLCHSVSDKRRDRIIETKNKGHHVVLAIAYWLLPTTFALSHYCHVGNHKSFFKVESKIIKDDKRKLLFSSEKSLTSKVFF